MLHDSCAHVEFRQAGSRRSMCTFLGFGGTLPSIFCSPQLILNQACRGSRVFPIRHVILTILYYNHNLLWTGHWYLKWAPFLMSRVKMNEKCYWGCSPQLFSFMCVFFSIRKCNCGPLLPICSCRLVPSAFWDIPYLYYCLFASGWSWSCWQQAT